MTPEADRSISCKCLKSCKPDRSDMSDPITKISGIENRISRRGHVPHVRSIQNSQKCAVKTTGAKERKWSSKRQ
jgi:hypothetical protein